MKTNARYSSVPISKLCLIQSGGAILGGSVAWSLLRMSYYFWTSDLGVELSTSVLFMAGALLCLPTCWLSTLVPYHTKSMSLNATVSAIVVSKLFLRKQK